MEENEGMVAAMNETNDTKRVIIVGGQHVELPEGFSIQNAQPEPVQKVVDPLDDPNLKLADVPQHIKGDTRLPGESQEEFKLRRAKEKKAMKIRLKYGARTLKSDQPYRSSDRAYKKAIAEHKKAMGGNWANSTPKK